MDWLVLAAVLGLGGDFTARSLANELFLVGSVGNCLLQDFVGGTEHHFVDVLVLGVDLLKVQDVVAMHGS